MKAWKKGDGIDWANAEALAFGSLLIQGTPIRLSGQGLRQGNLQPAPQCIVRSPDRETACAPEPS